MGYLNAAFWFLVGVVPAAYFLPRIRGIDGWRVGAFFILAGGASLVLRSPPLFFFLYGSFAVALTGWSRLALFYPAFLIAVPEGIEYTVPFPGINYLIELDPGFFMALLLIPVAFSSRMKTARNPLGAIIIFWAIIEALLAARGAQQTATNILRFVVVSVISGYVPFKALAKGTATRENFRQAIWFTGAGMLLMGAIGLWFKLRRWDIFLHVVGRGGGAMFSRGGVLRTGGSMPAVLYGYTSFIGAAILLQYRHLKSRAFPPFWAWVAVGVAAVSMSTSRGAILGAIAFVAAFWVYTRQNDAQRNTIYALFGVGALFLSTVITTIDLSWIDSYGTFAYRQRIFQVSIEQYVSAPLFGQTNYLSNPRFDQLVQGEGIVDIVNSFLQVALAQGSAGLIPFIAIFVISIRMTLKASRVIPKDALGEGLNAQLIGQGLAAAIFSYAVLLNTVSMVSYMKDFVFIFAGLAVAYRQVAQEEEEAST
jgi:hypothetical protein